MSVCLLAMLMRHLVEMDKLRQFPANGKGGVGFEQRLFSNSMSKTGRDGSARSLSLVRHGVGHEMEIPACWPIRGFSASLTTAAHYYIVIAHRYRTWS